MPGPDRRARVLGRRAAWVRYPTATSAWRALRLSRVDAAPTSRAGARISPRIDQSRSPRPEIEVAAGPGLSARRRAEQRDGDRGRSPAVMAARYSATARAASALHSREGGEADAGTDLTPALPGQNSRRHGRFLPSREDDQPRLRAGECPAAPPSGRAASGQVASRRGVSSAHPLETARATRQDRDVRPLHLQAQRARPHREHAVYSKEHTYTTTGEGGHEGEAHGNDRRGTDP